jgi:L-ascorbate metabolism protein UlaG (beta-lactamase superfamily)
MDVTFYGQSCFLMDIDGAKVLFDPFITNNPLAPKIDITTIKPDFILLSHGHFDHVDDAVAIAKSSGAKVVSNPEIGKWLETQGVDKSQITSLNLGGSMQMPFGSLQLVPAWHSSDLPDGTPGGTAGGFIVTHSVGSFYFSGDTSLFQEMKLFSRRQKLDFAILCIGDHYTMGYEDAAIAAEFLEVEKVIGMHFDTFPPIKIDHDKAVEAFKKVNKNLVLPVPGQKVTI